MFAIRLFPQRAHKGGQAEAIPQGHIQADVPNIRQASIAIARAACAAERLRLKCSSVAVPQILGVG